MKNNKNKFVFLDVDGVLNNQLYYQERVESGQPKEEDYPKSEFDPRCIEMLNHLQEKTGCKYVISSSWRQASGRILRSDTNNHRKGNKNSE